MRQPLLDSVDGKPLHSVVLEGCSKDLPATDGKQEGGVEEMSLTGGKVCGFDEEEGAELCRVDAEGYGGGLLVQL